MDLVSDSRLDQVSFSAASLLKKEVLGAHGLLRGHQTDIVSLLNRTERVDIDGDFQSVVKSLTQIEIVFVGVLVVQQQVFKLLIKLFDLGVSFGFWQRWVLLLDGNDLFVDLLRVSFAGRFTQVELIKWRDGRLATVLSIDELSKAFCVTLNKSGLALRA